MVKRLVKEWGFLIGFCIALIVEVVVIGMATPAYQDHKGQHLVLHPGCAWQSNPGSSFTDDTICVDGFKEVLAEVHSDGPLWHTHVNGESNREFTTSWAARRYVDDKLGFWDWDAK